LGFLDATLDYLQICIKNLFPRSPLGGVSVEILDEKNNYPAILVFGRHFGFNSWLTIFAIKYEYFLIQNILLNGKMLTR
jgi:hypothetical protein